MCFAHCAIACIRRLAYTYILTLIPYSGRFVCIIAVCVRVILPFHSTSHSKHYNNSALIGINGVSNFIRVILSGKKHIVPSQTTNNVRYTRRKHTIYVRSYENFIFIHL